MLNIERPVNDFGTKNFGPPYPKTIRMNAAGKEIRMRNQRNENKNNKKNNNNETSEKKTTIR